MKMDINIYIFIYLLIMDEIHPMIYVFTPIHKWYSSMTKMTLIHMESFIYGHIHPLKSH
jgi:hypothetical protein